MKNLHYILILLLPLCFSASDKIDNRPEKRIALVIGNSSYTGDLYLKNPVNDADSMRNVLREMGFEVQITKNANFQTMEAVIDKFDDRIQEIDQSKYKVVTLFYYSGHGMEVDGINYLIPVQARISSPADLRYKAVSLNWIIDKLDIHQNYLNIIMMDACRNNPLSKTIAAWHRKKYPNKDYGVDPFEGLGLPEAVDYKSGMYISFATAPGRTTDSGDNGGTTSPYVYAFLKHVREPNIPIQLLFPVKIGKTVYEVTRQTQEPWQSGSFFDLFVINKKTYVPDRDGDGFPDGVDKCPNMYSLVNNGCPEIDSDGDGFPNKTDNCPNEYSLTNGGCKEVTPPVEDKNLPNLAYVRGGSFQMGSNDGDKYEKPIHTVNISSFYMGKYEITNAEFVKFLNAHVKKQKDIKKWIDINGSYKNEKCRIQKNKKYYFVQDIYENYPVIYVSWYGATAYCKWLCETTGQNYRLPTEAEWEYAARGGNKSKGNKYAGSNNIDEVAWYILNANKSTHEIGIKQGNELDIYDMSGNVWEWCKDGFKFNYIDAPSDGSSWGNLSPHHVIRGGSWNSESKECKITNRAHDTPTAFSFNNGFRIALTK